MLRGIPEWWRKQNNNNNSYRRGNVSSENATIWLVGISESGFVNGYATHLQVVRPVDRGGRLGAVLHYTG
jgi:hypothetical protein